jgi:hypothetical protein
MASVVPNFEDDGWATEVCCKAIQSQLKFEAVAPLFRVADIAKMAETAFRAINDTVFGLPAAELRGTVEYLAPMLDRDAKAVREAMGRAMGKSQERLFVLMFPAVYRRVIGEEERQEELAFDGF